MQRRFLSILAIVAVCCCGIADAQVPRKLNYQGFLTSPSGAPINSVALPLMFKLYDVSNALVYSETQSVTVSNGIFNVLIGSVTLLTLPFDAQYTLGITMGADPEMTPRQPLAASPYAVRSASTESLAATASVAGSQITGAISTATLPTASLTGTIGTAQIGNASVTAAKLASNSCSSGQVLQYNGSTWVCTTPAASAVVEFGSFFGMTAGPGNTGTNDYPAIIAIAAPGPSAAFGSALNFPRASAPAVGGIVINNPGPAQPNNTEFILPSVGTYRVTWRVAVTESAQWSLWINTAPTPGGGGLFSEVSVASGAPAHVGQAVGSAQLVGDVVFRNAVANSAIQIRNYASPSAVSVTPLPGGTQAQAVSLIIQRLQ